MSHEDTIDRIVSQWAREMPGHDLEAMGIIGRLLRTTLQVGRVLEETLAGVGLSGGEFDVLAALRRSGAPYRLTPTVLARTAMLSPAAMTNRIDRLEALGLVRREASPDDRRSVTVRLTDSGRDKVEAAFHVHLANETRLLAGFSPEERAQLDGLLRKLLAVVEPG